MDRRLIDEIPGISSTLRWEDVLLPTSLSEADLDRIIFAEMTSQSRKTALVIAKAITRCEALGLPVDAEMIGARLAALSDADRINSEGDIRQWRHSEVRLKS